MRWDAERRWRALASDSGKVLLVVLVAVVLVVGGAFAAGLLPDGGGLPGIGGPGAPSDAPGTTTPGTTTSGVTTSETTTSETTAPGTTTPGTTTSGMDTREVTTTSGTTTSVTTAPTTPATTTSVTTTAPETTTSTTTTLETTARETTDAGGDAGEVEDALDVERVESCESTCRDVTVTLENTGTRTARDVDARTEILVEDDVIWTGNERVGELPAGESYTTTRRVDVGFADALAIRGNDGYVTIRTTVESANATTELTERRKVL